nr:ABC-three component system middle component 1 [uncultured Deefgea sp.]
MINIINNILSSNGYIPVESNVSLGNHAFYLFSSSKESMREEYFVTIQVKPQSNEAALALLEEKAQELFEAISKSGVVDLHFEKNCTLIICHEEENISRKTILALEEDQYNFKKNVITYTTDELTTLNTHLTKNKIEHITNEAINKIINARRGNDFLAFKNGNANKDKFYSLILKIVLKLPFIIYSPQEYLLTNLNSEIESSFSPSQALIYKRLLESEAEWTDENIHQQVSAIWGELA